jgi:hypothetical protein
MLIEEITMLRLIITLCLLIGVQSSVHGQMAYALTVNNTLLRIPNYISPPGAQTVGSITGILPSHTLSSIDFRPATGNLFAISVHSSGTLGQLYHLNTSTAALTTVGSGFNLSGNTSSNRVTMNYDPVVDQLRVISSGGQNYRVSAVTGELIQNETNLNPGLPQMVSMAYNNSSIGASSTTLYGMNLVDNILRLVRIGGLNGDPNPNQGEVIDVGSTGLTPGSTTIGFDINEDNQGWLNVDLPGNANDLTYIMDLNNGTVSAINVFNQPINSFSFALAAVPEPTVFLLVLAAGGIAVVHHRWKIFRASSIEKK